MPILGDRGFGMVARRSPAKWGAKRTEFRSVEAQRRNWRRLFLISLGSYVALWAGLILATIRYAIVPILVASSIAVAAWLFVILFMAWWWGPFDALPQGWGNRAKSR